MSASPRLLGHIAFKIRERIRSWDEARGGWEREAGRQIRWEQNWLDRHGALGPWLRREGAGRFWLTPDGGPRWARRACTGPDLAMARLLARGRMSLLGVDEAEIGLPPRWRNDLYSGYEWPLEPAFRIPIQRRDGSDIRTIWELSRGYPLVPLAKAYHHTADAGFLAVVSEHWASWLAENPPGRGPNWLSPMDAGIRAANWILGLILLADAPGLSRELVARVLANLRLSGWFVERHLEWHPTARGNHYLANAVGLVYLGAFFRDDLDGARWLAKGSAILREEMSFQVHADGVTREAALGYHRLVTELFTFGGLVSGRNLPEALPASYWESLDRMRRFMSAYLPVSGEAPMIGDADDGRLHCLCAEALRDPRRHQLGLPRSAPAPAGSAAFPEGGFYVLRAGRSHAVVRCGSIGLRGAGCHDHNDQLGFELVVDGVRLVTDSGTFAYTRDLRERYAFRSTAAHSVPQLGGEEQNPIVVHRPWRVLADRTRSECTSWEAGAGGARFAGRHFGYAHRDSRAICARSLRLSADGAEWQLEDSIEGKGEESLVWRLHLAPGLVRTEEREPGRWTVRHAAAPSVVLTIATAAPLRLALAPGRMSDRYGSLVERPCLELAGTAELPIRISCRIAGSSPAGGSTGAPASPPDRPPPAPG